MGRPSSIHKGNVNLSGDQEGGVLADLPRREFLEATPGNVPLSHMRFVSFKLNHLRALGSFLRWLLLILDFLLSNFFDFLRAKVEPAQRALRLRGAFERAGGAFVKLGIHLSMRLDFVPWAYCHELACMTDHMKPFPVKDAIETIEHSTGKELSETFIQFDPEPIISTSVACHYQAVLKDGEKVVVKVRRPGIGERFMADIEAFDWLLSIAEFLTIFRPGFTAEMRMEFRDLLMDELDFIQEARRQDAFRRAASKSRKNFFTAPRIYLDLNCEEMVVSSFASGIWLWELLTAVEHEDQAILGRARALNIDAEKVSKRLLWVNNWSWSEHLFFHGDPNPDNVIVGQDGELFFINFTSTGTLSREKRQAMRKNLQYAYERDPQNMARASLILLEPLPPIDLIELVQELETYNWQLIFALEAAPGGVSWQERTSAVQWKGIVQLARKYGITIDIQVLRLIRSTLLFESMAARLHQKIDYVEQFHKFNMYRAEQARRRVTDSVMDQMEGKGSEQTIVRIDRIAHALQGMAYRTSHMLSLPTVNFNTLMGKWSFTISSFFRFLGQTVILTGISVLLTGLILYVKTRPQLDLALVLRTALTNPIYLIALLMLIIVNGRAVLYRLEDKEV